MTFDLRRFRSDGPTNPNTTTREGELPSAAPSPALTLRQWASLVDQLVIRLDADGRCAEVSQNVVSLLGYSADSMVGRHIEEFEWPAAESDVFGLPVGQFQELRDRLSRDGHIADFKLGFADKDGEFRCFRCSGLSLKGPNQQSWLILVAEPVAPNAIAHKPVDDESDVFIDEVGRRAHSLSNAMTALVFEWDLAFGSTGPPAQRQAIDKLTSLIVQVSDESRALASLYANSLTSRKQSQQRENHAGRTDPNRPG